MFSIVLILTTIIKFDFPLGYYSSFDFNELGERIAAMDYNGKLNIFSVFTDEILAMKQLESIGN